MKTIWIVNGSLEAVAGIRRAKELGHYVVVSDQNPGAPGFEVADRGVVASTMDIDQTLEAVSRFHREQRPIDGILCIAADVPLTVATIAAELGLPGIPIEVAQLSSDKLAMKQRLKADGIAVPWFSPVENADHLQRLVTELGLPLVLKPVDSRGSRGVLRLTDGVDLGWAFETSKAFSPTDRVIVERFISGPQVSTESVMIDGTAYTPGFSDRNYEYLMRYAPYIIENGGDQPSVLVPELQQAIRTLVQQAALSLGVTNGVVKGDIVVDEKERPLMIELACRLSGGYFCTHQIPLSTGVDLLGAAIRQSLGEAVETTALEPKGAPRPVTRRDIFAPPGRVAAIRGVERAREISGVQEIVISVQPGERIDPPTDSNSAAGVVITAAETRDKAQTAALEAIAMIDLEML